MEPVYFVFALRIIFLLQRISVDGVQQIMTLSASTGLNVQGAIASTGSTLPSPVSQGAYLAWNYQGGTGACYLINQSGLGQGGFVYGEVSSSNNFQELFSVDPTGNGKFSGSLTSARMGGYKDFVSIDSVGAIPGIDCSSIVQSLIDAGTPVYVPASSIQTPWVFGGIELSRAQSNIVVIRGAGIGASRVQCPSSEGFVFGFTAPANKVQVVDISDLHLLGILNQNGITILGPPDSELTNGLYRALYLEGFQNAIFMARHNDLSFESISVVNCANGFYFSECGDVDMVNCRVQNPPDDDLGWGYQFYGSGDPNDHRAEGVRMTNCSTNGQDGIYSVNYGFMRLTNCSMTSCRVQGGLVFENVGVSGIANCEFQGVVGVSAALRLDSNCKGITITNSLVFGGTFGMFLQGQYHVVHGCYATDNSNNDIVTQTFASQFDACQLQSPVPQSIVEQAPGDSNTFLCLTLDGALVVTGPSSIQGFNV